ncbi:MAG: prepilin-type N-terminal cleavage/methylation domain-containing protein [Zetaproteobacteria bacterium]|nr:MAG: prepilin-type N-terminal cleavage/methylation domain-containing protein [Zetaproteobacteria bacterium]
MASRGEHGFTLIEILIVVAIIGVLVGIALPALQKYKARAYEAAVASDLGNVAVFEHAFYNEHEVFAGFTPADVQPTGAIQKKVMLANGTTVMFEARVSKDTEAVANVGALGQACTVGGHHPALAEVFAMELEQNDAIMYKPFPKGQKLTNADIPAATSGIDLVGWKAYQQR